METSSANSIALLRDSLNEAQATIRAYDTKAQIVGVGYIFALGIVSRVNDLLGEPDEVGVLYILVAWGVVILPILLFGLVLYPSRKTAPQLTQSEENVEHILYVDPNKHADVGELIEAAVRADPVRELAFELLKISRLREFKRQRFVRALFAAGISFALLFLSGLLHSFSSA